MGTSISLLGAGVRPAAGVMLGTGADVGVGGSGSGVSVGRTSIKVGTTTRGGVSEATGFSVVVGEGTDAPLQPAIRNRRMTNESHNARLIATSP